MNLQYLENLNSLGYLNNDVNVYNTLSQLSKMTNLDQNSPLFLQLLTRLISNYNNRNSINSHVNNASYNTSNYYNLMRPQFLINNNLMNSFNCFNSQNLIPASTNVMNNSFNIMQSGINLIL